MAEYMKHCVGDALGLVQVEPAALDHFICDVYDVSKDRKKVLLDASDHSTVDEGNARRIGYLEPYAPRLRDDADFEVFISVEQGARIIFEAAGIEDGEGAAPEQRIKTALTAVE